MSWYNDSEPSAGPPSFGAQPPGAPTNPVPPIGGGDLPTTPSGGSNKTMLLVVVGVVALLAMVTVGAGVFLLLSNRTEELNMSDYAEKMCDEVIAPNYEELMDLRDSDDWQSLNGFDESSSAADGRVYLRALTELSEWSDSMFGDLESFNDAHRLKGRNGDELQEELAELRQDGRDDAEDLREFIADADADDGEALDASFDEFNGSFAIMSLFDSDIGTELAEALADVDETCSFL